MSLTNQLCIFHDLGHVFLRTICTILAVLLLREPFLIVFVLFLRTLFVFAVVIREFNPSFYGWVACMWIFNDELNVFMKGLLSRLHVILKIINCTFIDTLFSWHSFWLFALYLFSGLSGNPPLHFQQHGPLCLSVCTLQQTPRRAILHLWSW